jgi:hypothetical protein
VEWGVLRYVNRKFAILWTSGIIKQREGPLMYKVEIEPGTIWRRHIDQLRDSEINENNIEVPEIVLPSQ